MRSYSMDLRERVVAASLAGQRTAEVAERFSVSMAWVRHIKTQAKAGQSIAPGKPGGTHPPKVSPEHSVELLEWLRAEPGLTLEQLRARLAERFEVHMCVSGVHRMLQRLGWSLKKRHSTPKSKPARMSSSNGSNSSSKSVIATSSG